MLQILDAHWREHLAALDHLRQGIHLRGYAQKNPKQEYKREAFELFGAMLESVKLEVTKTLTDGRDPAPGRGRRRSTTSAHVRERAVPARRLRRAARPRAEDGDGGDVASPSGTKAAAVRAPRAEGRAQRSLPCGSGKKYKHCHGKLT